MSGWLLSAVFHRMWSGRKADNEKKGEVDMASKQSSELARRASAIYEEKLRSRET